MSRITEAYRSAWRTAKTVGGAKGLYDQVVLVAVAVAPLALLSVGAVLLGSMTPPLIAAATLIFAGAMLPLITLAAVYGFVLLQMAMFRTLVEAIRR